MTKLPLVSETATRSDPVCTFVAVMRVPGAAAPEPSATEPKIVTEPCAAAATGVSIVAAARTRQHVMLFMMFLRDVTLHEDDFQLSRLDAKSIEFVPNGT